jgi:hypothetical protein
VIRKTWFLTQNVYFAETVSRDSWRRQRRRLRSSNQQQNDTAMNDNCPLMTDRLCLRLQLIRAHLPFLQLICAQKPNSFAHDLRTIESFFSEKLNHVYRVYITYVPLQVFDFITTGGGKLLLLQHFLSTFIRLNNLV